MERKVGVEREIEEEKRRREIGTIRWPSGWRIMLLLVPGSITTVNPDEWEGSLCQDIKSSHIYIYILPPGEGGGGGMGVDKKGFKRKAKLKVYMCKIWT